MTGRTAKKKWDLFFRILFSTVLISYILYKVGPANLINTLRHINFFYMWMSILLLPVLIFLSAWKWQVILKAQQITVSVWRLFWLYTVGYFFNNILPVNVGGDVIRAYALRNQTGKGAEAFSSVFLERFTGLTALLCMAIVSFFFVFGTLKDIRLIIIFVFSILGYLLLFVLVFNARVLDWFSRRFTYKIFTNIFRHLRNFQEATLAIQGQKKVLVFAMANSFVFNFVAILNVYVSSRTFSDTMTLLQAFYITPIVSVIVMMPVSIGGLGLSESAFVILFQRFGLAGTLGLSTALFLRAKALVSGLAGGVYYLVKGLNKMQDTSLTVTPKDEKGDSEKMFNSTEIIRKNDSALKKYQNVFIGSNGLWKLVKFETLTGLFGNLPGMAGLFLRQKFYPSILRAVGRGTVLNASVTLRHSYKISIGKRCVIDEYCLLSAQGDDNSSITIGDEVLLSRGTIVKTRNGSIHIGDYANIGSNCRFASTSSITLGRHVLFANDCAIGLINHRSDLLDVPIMYQGFIDRGGVVIEDDVWLGAGVIVLDGVRIGKGSIIGALSLVTQDIPPYSIAVGIPAKVIRSRTAKRRKKKQPAGSGSAKKNDYLD
jgi:uncharacterized protein (TIRG00374 family)